MTAVLPSLAMALLCLLQAGAEVPVQPGFNSEKFAGTWHVVAAFSNCSDFLKMKDVMMSSITTISFTPEGDLDMNVIWPLPDRCQKVELLYHQNGQAGHYVAAQGQRDTRVVETDYSSYAVTYEILRSEHEFSIGMQLLTREQDVNPQLLEKFIELIPTMGLTKDMLAVLPKTDKCS
ncbi:lipocalin-15-like [Calonectris borealis]|uniref:lipocalin-15-like n=1 Tax=Calonectris borealis TaxID=1323832 RepID=UPI003F4C225C